MRKIKCENRICKLDPPSQGRLTQFGSGAPGIIPQQYVYTLPLPQQKSRAKTKKKFNKFQFGGAHKKVGVRKNSKEKTKKQAASRLKKTSLKGMKTTKTNTVEEKNSSSEHGTCLN